MAHDTPKVSPTAPAAPSTPVRGEAPKACIVRTPGRRTSVSITSDQLFAGADEVHIEHRGALYRLQRTSLGKLILTK